MKILGLRVVPTMALVSTAFANDPFDLMREVRSYRPFVTFNLRVGGTRFSGSFVSGPCRCDGTLSQKDAADEALAAEPRRMVFQILAGGRDQPDA